MSQSPGHDRRSLAAAGVGLLGSAAAIVAVTMFALDVRDPAAPSRPPQPPPAASRPASGSKSARALTTSRPIVLDIPRIGVRTPLMLLAKNADRTVQVPPLSQVRQAGWYRLGASPGARGPAVIIGHVDSRRGPGVFFRLGDLRPGDIAKVTREDGKIATFEIDSVEQVSKTSFPTQRVYGSLPYAGLRLVTCGGRFDRTSGHYTENVIAYGHLT